MQYKDDFRFPVEDSFTTSQSFHYPALTHSNTGSSVYDRLTPDSRRSTPTGIKIEYDEHNIPRYPVDLSPPHGAPGNYILRSSKMDAENISFTDTLPSTPMKRYDSFSSVYDMVDMNLGQHNIHTLTPSNSFGIYNVSPQAIEDSAPTALMMTPSSSIMMTPTRSMSGSDLADSPSPWSGEIQDSPNHFFGQTQMVDNMEPLHLNPQASFMMAPEALPGTASPEALQRQMMILQAQQRSEDLHRAQHDRSRALMRVQHRRHQKRGVESSQGPPVEFVSAAKHKCEYPGCSKAFRRMEHLKRHKQTYAITFQSVA